MDRASAQSTQGPAPGPRGPRQDHSLEGKPLGKGPHALQRRWEGPDWVASTIAGSSWCPLALSV